jgi:hypothetical protein
VGISPDLENKARSTAAAAAADFADSMSKGPRIELRRYKDQISGTAATV